MSSALRNAWIFYDKVSIPGITEAVDGRSVAITAQIETNVQQKGKILALVWSASGMWLNCEAREIIAKYLDHITFFHNEVNMINKELYSGSCSVEAS